MRKTVAITLLALGFLCLILCAAFTVVQLTAAETAWFEQEFTELSVAEQMNMTLGDLGASLRTLVDYMNGGPETIDLLVTVNGQQVRMFDLDIEIVHMREVRDLWQWFVGARNVGLLLGMVLGGTWAAISFDSFWTAFHRLIFPGSENWLLPAESRMIQMLPSRLFRDLVMRMGGRMLTLFLAVAAVCGLILYLRQRKQSLAEAIPQEVKPKTPEEELAAVKGPDLLIVHKKANMSVTERRKLNEELDREKKALEGEDQPEQAEEPQPETAIGSLDEAVAADFRDAALDVPVEGRKKIEFAPVDETTAKKSEEEDDDYDELL